MCGYDPNGEPSRPLDHPGPSMNGPVLAPRPVRVVRAGRPHRKRSQASADVGRRQIRDGPEGCRRRRGRPGGSTQMSVLRWLCVVAENTASRRWLNSSRSNRPALPSARSTAVRNSVARPPIQTGVVCKCPARTHPVCSASTPVWGQRNWLVALTSGSHRSVRGAAHRRQDPRRSCTGRVSAAGGARSGSNPDKGCRHTRSR